jgi:predicted nucleic acid-binding protein
MAGLTLDSGALIAFERNDRRVLTQLKEAAQRGAALTVPTVVIAEVWRGGARSARVARLLRACAIEALSERIARKAGEAVAITRGAGVIDAIVTASAAQRFDLVLTSDAGDFRRLCAAIPGARVLAL